MIRSITLLILLAAPRIAVLDVDASLDTIPSNAGFQAQSLLTQIEISLAATARQLDVESAARQTRVSAATTQLLRQVNAIGFDQEPKASTIPGHRSGHEQKLRAQIGNIEFRETIQMQRDALVNSFPEK